MAKYTFRQSSISLFVRNSKEWLKQQKEGKGITPNSAMLFGTAQHAIREKENGKNGEVCIKIKLSDIVKQIQETSQLSSAEFQKPRILKSYLKDYDINGNEVEVTGHLDYYDGEIIKDYKYTRKLDGVDPYKFQVRFYQWLVWERDGVLVPACLEMNEVQDLSDELLLEGKEESGLKTTGVIKEHYFKPMKASDIIKFRKNIFKTIRKMIYLLSR